MKKRFLPILLALTMCLSLLPGTALAEGEPQPDLTISTKEQLIEFRDEVNAGTKSYKGKLVQLGADINLNNEAWTPIGKDYDHPFQGTFDGNGKTISGLNINVTNSSSNTTFYYGLFGCVKTDENSNGGTLQNLAVSGSVSVNATDQVYVGGIAGWSWGTIQNCQFSGRVSGSGDTSNVGGVAGLAVKVFNSYNTGTVSGSGNNSDVGGVAGHVYENGSVSNCYNTGNVSGSGDTSNVGGVAGFVGTQGSVTNCFYLSGSVSGSNNHGKAKSAKQFADQETFTTTDNANWDFTNTWVMGPFRPLLSWEAAAKTMGTGDSANSPYKISTVSELEELSRAVNAGEKYSGKYFQLTADLKLNEDAVPTWTAGDNESKKGIHFWTPIGTADYPFQGTFDGNGHTISGLAIEETTAGYYGLFGFAGDGIAENLAVSGTVSVNTDGQVYVGGIVGYCYGTIQNCQFSGSVSGSAGNSSVGGVAGYAFKVSNSYNTGTVSSSGNNSSVGGVAGDTYSVSNCYNTGNVSGSDYVGGVAGQAGQAGSNVSNCFYLKDTGSTLQGIGNNANAAGVEAASAERFASGEIAWKLQGKQGTQVWGQTLPGKNGDSPVLTADTTKRVYQVTVDTKETNTDADKTISYTNGIVTEPNPAPTKGGSAFRGWFVSTGENSYSQFDFNTPVSSDVTLLANWDCALGHPGTFTWETDSSNHWKRYGECGDTTEPVAHTYANGVCSECGATEPAPPSSGGGGGSTPSTPTVTVPVSSETSSVSVKATVKNGNASVEISDKQINQVVAEGAENVTVDLTGLNNVTSATLPAHVVETTSNAEDVGLTVALPTGSVSLDSTALSSLPADQDVTVSVKRVPATDLNEQQQAAVGDMSNIGLVFDVEILVNGEQHTDLNGGTVTISIPYTPKKGENPHKMTVWYIRDDGMIMPMGGYYDEENQCFVFEAKELPLRVS